MTIFDSLRNMTPEELVVFFVNEGGCPPMKNRPNNCYQQSCVACWLEYLFQEVKPNAKDKTQE